MVRRGSGRDDEAMTSTEHIDRPPVADRDGPLLIGYDGSEHAKDAIWSAASLLAVKDALVVTVWQPPRDIGAFAWYGAGPNTVNFAELVQGPKPAGALPRKAHGSRGRQAYGPSPSLSRRPRPSGRRSSRRPISTTRRQS